MQTGKKSLGVRSITYPPANTVRSSSKTNLLLRRMDSFDCSYEDLGENSVVREVSAEGRLRARHFLYAHSSSTIISSSSSSSSSSSLSQGVKSLRFSDERWCGPAVEQQVLASPKSRQRTSIRLSSGHSSVERLIDWKRHSPERRSSSQSCKQRHSRSSKRRYNKASSTTERRSHFCSSVSLPLSTQPPSDTDSTASSSSTASSTQGSSEGRRRRSQFRRAWSLFSLACDKDVEREKREKSPHQSILRPPTRHFYRRGLSGLPIECSSTTLGLVY